MASSSSSSPLTAAATARALESFPASMPFEAAAPQVAKPSLEPQVNISYQPSLFRDGGLGAPKVIPIPTLTPSRPQNPEEHSIRRRVPARSTPRPRRASDSQQALQFPEGEADAALESQAELIFCEARVALPGHRVLATLVDLSWILIGLGLFVATILFLGVDLVISRQTAPLLTAVGVIVALLYRSVWYFANGDTPGMCFAGLRLVDFDGRRPNREQRGLRQVASLLSLVAAGLGLVWALVDEENLTWHDHMSKTFPTPS
jgi:uncharacterized RDD family membrane protein YckC